MPNEKHAARRRTAKPATEERAKAAKRFNLDLSAEAYDDLEELARMSGGRTKSEVFRLALSLLKMIYPALQRGEELCLVDRANNKERSIVIP